MRTVTLRLKAEEALVITSGSAASMAHQTLGFIPGNMLLGACAMAWRRLHPGVDPDADASFRRLFLDGDVAWGTASPMCGDEAGVPVPLSYMRLKNRKGLPREGEAAADHLVVNLLRSPDDASLKDELVRAGRIDSSEVLKLKKFGSSFMGKNSLRMHEEKRDWNIHVALGTQRSAMEGQLFGYSSIAPGTEFSCELRCRTEEAAHALAQLLSSVREFRVGRSRSAGYGLVSITRVSESSPEVGLVSVKAGMTCAAYLHSHFVPSASWLTPAESFALDLGRACGADVRLKKLYCSYTDIQGYNGFWKKPRTARAAFTQGSVFLCEFDRDVELPSMLSIGADQIEGYGRVEFAPAFLADLCPSFPAVTAPQCETPKLEMGASPVWNVVRRRAMDKQCEEEAFSLLLSADWSEFCRSASQNSHPTQSQRGGIRRIVTELPPAKWKAAFESILENSGHAAEQWKNAVVFSPNTKRKEQLDEVMKWLLDAEAFGPICLPRLELPGSAPTEQEWKEARAKAHTVFMLRLLASWGRLYRSDEAEEK